MTRFAIWLFAWGSATAQIAAPAPPPPTLDIIAPPALEPVADDIRRLDSRRLAGVMRIVGLDDPGPTIRVILAPENSELGRETPSWIAGLAFGLDGMVVLFPNRAPSYPHSSLEALLHHEVAHVLITRAAGDRTLPRWFNEGLALVAERTWGLEDRTRVALEQLFRRRHAIEDLDGLFTRDRQSAERAYALAGAFMRDLLQQHGPDLPSRILSRVARGEAFADAFARTTGLPLTLASRGFWQRSFWTQWLPWLTSSFVIWMGVTLLALYAIKKRRDRSRALRQQWELEETAEDLGWKPDETVH